MQKDFAAIVKRDARWYVAHCPEVPGANGQGETREKCLANLQEAITLMLEYNRDRVNQTDHAATPDPRPDSTRNSTYPTTGTAAAAPNAVV